MKKFIALPIMLLLATSCNKEEKKGTPTTELKNEKPKTDTADKAAADKVAADKAAADKAAADKAAAAGKATEFVSAEHKFSVSSLRAPRVEETSTTTAVGKIDLTTYMFNAKGAQGAYGVMVSDLPFAEDAGDEARLKAIVDAQAGLVKQYSATITNQKDFKLDGNHGREFDLSATHPQMGEMAGHYKIVIRDKTMYQIMRVGSPTATELIAEATDLLESFKLTE
ncbi:MAG: hypothetical protein JKY56_26205 [Kofleriaceae bacterium]|nr:hypothetical protein [Kofleriaceae bacterium]